MIKIYSWAGYHLAQNTSVAICYVIDYEYKYRLIRGTNSISVFALAIDNPLIEAPEFWELP